MDPLEFKQSRSAPVDEAAIIAASIQKAHKPHISVEDHGLEFENGLKIDSFQNTLQKFVETEVKKQLDFIQAQNEKLRKENEQLQQTLRAYTVKPVARKPQTYDTYNYVGKRGSDKMDI